MSIQRQQTGMLALCAQISIWVTKKAPEHLIWPFFSKYQILMLWWLFIKIRSPNLKSKHRAPTFQSLASGLTPHMSIFRCHEIFIFLWLGPILRSISWPLKLLGAIFFYNLSLIYIPNRSKKF